MPISPNFTSILHEEKQVNFLQCYPNGYLKYTDLCNILQLTAALHAELGGISFSDMQAHHQAWVLSRMRLEIHRLPKWRDVVTVKTWIQSLENSRSIRCLEMYLGDEKLVGCETFWAVFNTQSRRPEALALPHEHFEKYPEEQATAETFSKIDTTVKTEVVTEKTILLSDLDIVNHANSVKYLEWCLDYVAPELLLQQTVQSIEINYLREVSLHDTVTIMKNESDATTTFTINSGNKVCCAVQLNFQ